MLKNHLKPSIHQKSKYLEIWSKIFTGDDTKDYKDVLHIVKLHLITPLSDAKFERMFSWMNSVKSDFRNRQRLDHCLRISEELIIYIQLLMYGSTQIWDA